MGSEKKGTSRWKVIMSPNFSAEGQRRAFSSGGKILFAIALLMGIAESKQRDFIEAWPYWMVMVLGAVIIYLSTKSGWENWRAWTHGENDNDC